MIGAWAARLRRLLRGAAATAVAAVALSACDDDPSGAGALTLTVEGPVALGAAVVELRGGVIEGVEPVSSGWAVVETLPPAGGTAVHRLVTVQDQPGILRVEVRVPDRDAELPAVTVLEASDAQDRPLAAVAGVEVSIRR